MTLQNLCEQNEIDLKLYQDKITEKIEMSQNQVNRHTEICISTPQINQNDHERHKTKGNIATNLGQIKVMRKYLRMSHDVSRKNKQFCQFISYLQEFLDQSEFEGLNKFIDESKFKPQGENYTTTDTKLNLGNWFL